jgi:hypothetical protein
MIASRKKCATGTKTNMFSNENSLANDNPAEHKNAPVTLLSRKIFIQAVQFSLELEATARLCS